MRDSRYFRGPNQVILSANRAISSIISCEGTLNAFSRLSQWWGEFRILFHSRIELNIIFFDFRGQPIDQVRFLQTHSHPAEVIANQRQVSE